MAITNGSASAVFTVKLSEAADQVLNIGWKTKDGTGKAGIDYEAAEGSVAIPAGELSGQIQVLVYGRAVSDTPEQRTFSIVLTPPVDAILTAATVDCTIDVVDEDGERVTSVFIPAGPRGVGGRGLPGLSAYELAKATQGFVMSLAEWLASLNGKPVTLRRNAANIEWQLQGDAGWQVLMPLADIAGANGREVQMQKGAAAIQWRYSGATAWTDLVPLSDLKGDPGDSDVTFATSAESKAATRSDVASPPSGVREFMEQFGITAAFTTPISDLNNATRGQFFSWDNTAANAPVAGSYGRGFTLPGDADNLTQFGFINATGIPYTRFKTAGAWGNWFNQIQTDKLAFLSYSNPGATPFPAGAFTAIPFFTSGEANGMTMTGGGTTVTVAAAGLYLFELEVRIDGGGTNMPPVGTNIGVTIGTSTVPTDLRAGFSVDEDITARSIFHLTCVERLSAGDVRKAYIFNSGSASYQVKTANIKVTRLGA